VYAVVLVQPVSKEQVLVNPSGFFLDIPLNLLDLFLQLGGTNTPAGVHSPSGISCA
jgi:hypothetical protein